MKNISMNVHVTAVSGNRKTGPIPVTTSSARTCPKACPFNNANEGGCYASGGPLAMHWKKVTEGERGTDYADFLSTVAKLPEGQFWRHNQAGDLQGDGEQIDAVALAKLAEANSGKRGFSYTHYDVENNEKNRLAVELANFAGFTVNLSANDLEHADRLSELNCGPVVVVLDSEQTMNLATPAGRTVVVCPATVRDDVTCQSCQMCQRQRAAIIGFPAHGSSKKKAAAVAAGRGE